MDFLWEGGNLLEQPFNNRLKTFRLLGCDSYGKE